MMASFGNVRRTQRTLWIVTMVDLMSLISAFFVMLFAMLWRSIVLPVRGGATMRPRCPLPSGVSRSITRPDRFSASVSRLSFCAG